MKNQKSFFYPIIFMTVVTAFFVFILSAFSQATKDTIAFNNESELRYKILYIFDILPESKNPKDIEKVFNEHVEERFTGGKNIYVLMDGEKEISYAVPVEGPGLWGTISGYVGLNEDYSKITGIDFVKQSETPGLGGRISEESYKEQFREIDISDSQDGKFIVSSPQSGSNVDAIAGATQTSSAVEKLINEDLNDFFKKLEVK
ncbi:FMN-binding protein [Sedimentibacter sp. B4]|uniref:FMN-binding protein n=1 Tax=Sedimentibacter sp. B4 TaxID=304766 RepID=UPI0003137837|nr:FMN-binding protein [Sedimentibacter sp. B4]